jgi:formylglycine-generating enzyme required for sulfatase activity
VGIFNKGTTPEEIFDLGGNVWEWTCSDYHTRKVRDDFDFDRKVQKLFDEQKFSEYFDKLKERDRQIPVLRGGSWGNSRDYARCADRNRNDPDDRNLNIGFRCARTKK